MISLRTLLLFYRRHLRVQPLREIMAVVGVAAGVALLFAVQISNSSITGSFEELVHGVAGRATLEVAARSPEGFAAGVGEEIAETPGVRAAAPVLTQQITMVGPKGTRALTLVGADERLATLGGKLISSFEKYAAASRRGLLVVAQPTAQAIGAKPGSTVAIQVAARTEHLTLGAVVPTSDLGALAESPVAATSLPVAQTLGGLPGRISRVLVEPDAGAESRVRGTLASRFGATLNVRSVDTEAKLLAGAAKPEAQVTALFSAISLAVGMILAYNALLLASGERRVFMSYLIQLGTPDSAIVTSLAFDALILGITGSLIGLAAGDAISLLAYRAPPGYLTAVFPIGGQRIVSTQTVLIALAAGVFAAFVAAALPAVALLRSSAIEPEEAGRTLSLIRRPKISDAAVFTSGAVLICASTVVSLMAPAVIVVALILIVGGLAMCLPMTIRYVLRFARRVAQQSRDPAARLASGELQASPTRSIALAATGMIAVLLVVTIGGSVADVQRAVRLGAEQTGSNADLWLKPGGASNVYATQPFAADDTLHRLRRLKVVSATVAYSQSFLDLPNRRVWVIGVPPQAENPIAESQLIKGNIAFATRRLREGGWIAISQTIADEHHLSVGDVFSLPTPSGISRLHIAATISNYGWLPGSILINANDYSRLWRTTRVSQLAVILKPGIDLEAGELAVRRALPYNSALTVQTAEERQSQISAVLGGTLSRLNQTTAIVLAAAIATVVAMMMSAVWQRRGRLDALISIGMSSTQLARLVFYESGCVLLFGCLIGIITGNAGQYLVDRWTQYGAGSPVHFAFAWQLCLRALLIATLISFAAAAIATVRATQSEPKTAFSIN